MSQQPHTYTQGHSNHTLATHLARTAETDAAFLLPYIKSTDIILDVGCGPGTITTGFTKYANQGNVHGIDLAPSVIEKATTLASGAGFVTTGPGSVIFAVANVLEGLPYPDSTFDIVFASQVFGHLPPPDTPLQALAEIRRVLKPGGIFASRDGLDQHFYPRRFDLDRLWGRNQNLVLLHGKVDDDPTGSLMPNICRKAGFDIDGGKVIVGVGSRVFSGLEARRFLANRAAGQLKPGDPFYQGWLDAGISEDEIQQTLSAAKAWAETEDAWMLAVQCEIIAWK